MRCLLTALGTVKALLVLSIPILLVAPGTEGQALNATLVSSANDLANALSNSHVNNIYINGELKLITLRCLRSLLTPELLHRLART